MQRDFIYFLDLGRESDLNIGTTWEYNSLAAGDCVLTNDCVDCALQVGDEIVIA